MDLEMKLALLRPQNIVPFLNELLDQATLEISWWGERLVYSKGYEGSVTVQDLAKKFFSAPFFAHPAPSPKERGEVYNLWRKLQNLCAESNRQLQGMRLYRFLVPLTEGRPWCRACFNEPVARLEDWHGIGMRQLFEFHQDEFRELWPNEQPEGKMVSGLEEYWFATPEMLFALDSTKALNKPGR